MASRENQGLHIALILLIMLSVFLCVISYVFYSKSESRRVTAEDANTRLAQAQKDLSTANFKVQTLTYMIIGGSKTLKQIEDDLANIPGGDTNDPAMAKLQKSFQDNMLLYGAPDQETESARNYESLPTFLLARIRDLNQQLTDLRRTENELNTQKTQLEQTSAERSQKFEEAANSARKELDAERQKFQTDLAEVRKTDGRDRLPDHRERHPDRRTHGADGRAAEDGEQENRGHGRRSSRTRSTGSTSTKSSRLRRRTPSITTVNQKEGVVYLNVGSADNLNLQQTFSVFDKGTTAVMQAKPKGRIEVDADRWRARGGGRILEDQVGNIIVPGDLVLTPTWAPGQQIHFAIAGFVDLTKDGLSDLEMLKRLITANGGVVDDEVTVQTRYLVEGADTGTGEEHAMTHEEQADFSAKIVAAGEIGVDRLSIDKLLALMGWKADVKSVILGTGTDQARWYAGSGGRGARVPAAPADPANPVAPEFRKRTPPARGAGRGLLGASPCAASTGGAGPSGQAASEQPRLELRQLRAKRPAVAGVRLAGSKADGSTNTHAGCSSCRERASCRNSLRVGQSSPWSVHRSLNNRRGL